MIDLPKPMTPADSKGRLLGPMPFNSHDWICGDWLNLTSRQHVARLNMLVWAWYNNPAGSIPNEPDCFHIVAHESRDWWKKHHSIVIAPWILCSDGRLYHPWLSERVNQMLGVNSKRRRDLGISQGDWVRLRAMVFERDDYTCVYCGERGGVLQCDHVTPLVSGGLSTVDNLVTSCSSCNLSKSGRSPSQWRKSA